MQYRMAALLSALACVLFWASLAGADSIYLYNGSVLHGKVTSRAGAATVVVETNMGVVRIHSSRVSRIEKDDQGIPPETPAAGPASRPDDDPVAASDPQAQARFAETSRQADRVKTASEGLALWKVFLKEHAEGPLADLARQQADLWQQRVDQDLVRFGPDWLPAAEVAQRSAKADKLLAESDAAADLAAAVRLLDDAAAAHPYRVDIPFRKSKRYYDAKRELEMGRALGDAVKIDADHVPSRNNIAIVAATQKKWDIALSNLARAAANLPGDGCDVVLDNIDQVLLMVAEAGFSGLGATEATRQRDLLVDRLHEAGQHVGQVRWGAQWMPEATCQKYVKDNQELDRKLADNRNQMAQYKKDYDKLSREKTTLERDLEGLGAGGIDLTRTNGTDPAANARDAQRVVVYMEQKRKLDKVEKQIKDIETNAKKLKADSEKLAGTRHVPTWPGKLVLLTVDGKAQMGVVELVPPAPPPDPNAKPPAKAPANPPAKPGN
ncbi:MAG: hypothetical protein BIFFINMI_03520 [Phycisphaerae bacterium]|nr:hypothetical protein [Phycisphaerae bacterium]